MKENVRDQKSKNQKPGGFAGTAVKGKGKNNKSGHAPPYLPVRQELQSDSGSEEGYASIAMVQPRPPPRTDYKALNAHKRHKRKDTRKDDWSKAQPVNGVEVQTSLLASMCLADDDLVGNQLCPGTPTSYPQSLFRPASPQGSDQTVKPRPQGPQLELMVHHPTLTAEPASPRPPD